MSPQITPIEPQLTLDSQLQQGAGAAGEEGYNGMFDCFRKIIRNEGYVSFPLSHSPGSVTRRRRSV